MTYHVLQLSFCSNLDLIRIGSVCFLLNSFANRHAAIYRSFKFAKHVTCQLFKVNRQNKERQVTSEATWCVFTNGFTRDHYVAPEYVFSQKCYLDCSTRAIEKKFLLLFSDRLLSDQENSKLMLVSYTETKTKS